MKIKQLPVYKRILQEIEEEIQAHPDYADLRNQMGLLLAAEGDLGRAEKEFGQAIRLNPKYREAALHLGYLYLEMGRWKEAEEIFLSEARKNPKEGFLQHLLGMIYLQMGRQREAISRIQKALRSHPACQDYYRKKGIWKRGKIHLLERKGRGFGKIHLRRLYGPFHHFVGLYLAREGKSVQSIRELEKAAKLIPDAFQFHSNLGSVYYHYGDYRKAIEEFKKAIKLNPILRNGICPPQLYLWLDEAAPGGAPADGKGCSVKSSVCGSSL
ncbi:MAG: tetratricopeptide repeat protein [Deltaproteobacteria bacterium]|nr:tetratricopeptide repeat protein [Deltaproteobacteria bacterium]